MPSRAFGLASIYQDLSIPFPENQRSSGAVAADGCGADTIARCSFICFLFDALRAPRDDNEALLSESEPYARRCVCLLEDDSMITAFAVETHASLEAMPKGEVKLNGYFRRHSFA